MRARLVRQGIGLLTRLFLVAAAACVAACGSSSTPTRSVEATPVASAAPPAGGDDAKRVVQQFYDWYVPYMASRSGDVASKQREMAEAIDAQLLRALREDFDAQSRNPDEVVGLDFDAVTNSQDPCDRYETSGVRSIGGAIWVDLKGVGGCVDHSAPDVSAEVSCPTAGSCRIVNFHYPSPGAGLPPFDLRSELKRMRDERARPVSADDHGGRPSAARRSN